MVYDPLQAGHVPQEQRLVLAVRAVTCQHFTISLGMKLASAAENSLRDRPASAELPSCCGNVCVLISMLVKFSM